MLTIGIGTWQDDRIEFTIPAETPDGEYLVSPPWARKANTY